MCRGERDSWGGERDTCRGENRHGSRRRGRGMDRVRGASLRGREQVPKNAQASYGAALTAAAGRQLHGRQYCQLRSL